MSYSETVILNGWTEEAKQSYMLAAKNVFTEYYKVIGDVGCEMGWQGLDEELDNLPGRFSEDD
jgi:hypothetical protein